MAARGGAGKAAEASTATAAATGKASGERAGAVEPAAIRAATSVRGVVRIPDEQRPGPRLPQLARILSLQATPANHVGAGAIPAPRTAWSALPAELQARLAPIVGTRAIEAARLHIGPAANARADAHRARAVADGVDVFFADGEYRPGTRAGDALIAHELAHVDQAQRGLLHRPARKAMGGAEHDALEAAADHAGDQLSAGADVEKHKRPERDRKKPGAAAKQAVAKQVAATVAVAEGIVKDAAAKDAAAKDAAKAEGATAEDAAGGPKAKVKAPLELIMPEPPTELSAKERHRVSGVKGRAKSTATATATAPTGKENVDYAEARVQDPQQESDAKAAQQLATQLVATEPPSPEIVELCDKIGKLIEGQRPADKEGVFDDPAKEIAEAQGAHVEKNVKQNVKDANDSLAAIKTTPEGPQPPTAATIEPLPEQVQAPQVNATAATPDAVPPEQVNLDADGAAMDARAQDAGLHEEPAQLVQSGPVRDARDARGEMDSLAGDGAAEALKQQEAALTQANTNMAALQAQAAAALAATRKRHVTGVKTQQDELKGGEEELKTRLSSKANEAYKAAQTPVDTQLKALPEAAMTTWRANLPLISGTFNADILAVRADIRRRHSKYVGKLKAVKDWAFGLPPWVTRGYDAAEKKFAKSVCDLILGISAQVNTTIKACQLIIDGARQEIADIFTKDLPDGLKTWAEEQKLGFDKKLDTLQKRTEDTRDKFTKELAQNAGEAVQAARERIQALRQAAKGALSRFVDALESFLDDPIRFIIDGLLELLGISPKSFWAVIDKISAVISDIAWHPIRFISNLMDGVGAGFDLFFSHFPKHAREGFFKWLFRGLKNLGVEVPADFSLKSIITFFLQLMGLSWMRIRKMLADVIGDKYVAAAEKVLKLGELIAKGPEGILALIEDKLTPEAIFTRVLDMALDYVVITLIKTVAKYIIKLLNPVGAVLAAIEAVYKVAKWIFQNAASIFHFIEAVVNTLAAVVAGDTATVAKGVELGLAMLIPPVIDFLASLVDLGDLPEKVAEIVKSLQSWVEGIVKAIIKTLVETAKSLLASIGIGKKDGEKGKEGAAGAIGERLTFTSGKETHHLYIDVANKAATVMVSSSPMTLSGWLDSLVSKDIPALTDKEQQKKATELVGTARQQLAKTDADADKLAAAATPAGEGAATSAPAQAELGPKVNAEEEALRNTLEQLGTMFGKPMIVKSLSIKGAAKVTDYADALVTSIESTASSTDIHKEATGPDFIKALLERRKGEASFDDATGALTLNAPGASALGAAGSATEMGDAAAAGSGVARINFTKGQADFTLVGAIDEARAKLATGEAPPYKPVTQDILGGDSIQIKPADPNLVIVDKDGVRITERFAAADSEVFSKAETKAGQVLHAKSQKAFTTAGAPIEKVAAKGWLAANDRKTITDGTPKIVTIVTEFGTGLDITTLKRATETAKTQLDTVVFNMSVPPAVVGNAAYEKNFQDEVTRQLGLQEAGQNKLTVDAWVVNVATYKAPNQQWIASLGSATRLAVLEEVEARIKDAAAEALRETAELKKAQKTAAKIHAQLEAGKLTVAQAIKKITADSYIKNQFTGRYGNEVEWRAEHSEAINELLGTLEPLWAGLESRSAGYIKNAITHNADQVGGGEGKLPDITKVPKPKAGEDDTAWNKYLDDLEPYIGAAKVNSRIGPGWSANIEDIFKKVTTRHKKEASYPLWLMNFKLDVKYG